MDKIEKGGSSCLSPADNAAIKLQRGGSRSGRGLAACTEASNATAGRRLLWCKTHVHPTRAQSAVRALPMRMRVHGG